MLTDIIERNKKGEICHPYKYKRGQYAGAYVYILENNVQYQRADETVLCNLILDGYFQNGGRIRMVAKDAKPQNLPQL